ncbi:MAG: LAGLIDADG family homing endonuclease, partial [Candidatus Aenigmatarchaeota archaeon]
SGLEVEEIEASELEEGDFVPRRTIDRPSVEEVELDEPEYRERVELPDSAVEELRTERKRKNYSQRELSKQLGKGVNFVQQIENDYSSIYLENLRLLMDELSIEFQNFVERHDVKITEYPDLDRRFAQFLGYFYGDGHRDGNRLRITDKNRECLESYAELVEDLFNFEPVIGSHTDSSKDAYQLEINNVGIVRFLEKNFEGIYRKSVNGDIPNSVFYGSKATVEGFIGGLFDAEGDVGNKVRIAQAGEDTRKRVQSMLSSIGVRATVDTGRRVSVSSTESIAEFCKRIESLHPTKKERLDKLPDSGSRNEKMPVKSSDLHRMLDDAGMKGRVSGSPSYRELPTCIVDWYRRSSDSAATRETVETLVSVLEDRLEELKNLDPAEVKEARRSISVTRQEVAESTEASIGQVQVVEDRSYSSGATSQVVEAVETELENRIRATESNKKKLERLLEMDAEWHRIKEIRWEENEYGYLVDLKVSPNENFIAEDQIVHNCGMIPYLYKMGYEG